MKRENEFRGKTESGKWVYGDLIQYDNGDMAIIANPFPVYGSECSNMLNRYHVIPETVGQYTGMKDEDEKKIYEKDFLSNGVNAVGKVKFKSGMFLCDFYYTNKVLSPPDDKELHIFQLVSVASVIKVVGNEIDNPELLKE